MILIGINELVKRQTLESEYSHYEGSWESLTELVEANCNNSTPGYKPGVVLVPVPAEGFYSGVTEITEDTNLSATFKARRKGEAPFINIRASGEKIPAVIVEVVLYSAGVLAENDESTTEAEWEVISINARVTVEEEPLSPMAMARNFLEFTGGTKAEYTPQEFAESILYWSNKALVASRT